MSLCMSVRLRTIALLSTLGTLVLAARPAHAQQMTPATCGTENLLAGRLPSAQQAMSRDLRLVTDGQAAPEGAQWDAPPAVLFDLAAGASTILRCGGKGDGA